MTSVCSALEGIISRLCAARRPSHCYHKLSLSHAQAQLGTMPLCRSMTDHQLSFTRCARKSDRYHINQFGRLSGWDVSPDGTKFVAIFHWLAHRLH